MAPVDFRRAPLDITDVAGLAGRSGVARRPMYGSERSHDYFYSVAPQCATADRPAFDADADYANSQF
jgi:hypothetical protein